MNIIVKIGVRQKTKKNMPVQESITSKLIQKNHYITCKKTIQ